ncbi:MAG: SDR family NAD(P)-dependent oxidoreductase [Spirulinaceae cyanobacterium]
MFDAIAHPHILVVGASQGIGLGFVRQFLANPHIAHIYATYRRPETAAGLFALQTDRRLTCLNLDITDEKQIIQLMQQIQQQTQQLHGLINCVGLLHGGELQPEKSLRQLNAANLGQYFQINSIGAVLLAKQALPLFQHDEPSVLATLSAKIGSIGDNHLGGWYGYRASKAALNMLMRTAAIEYQRKRTHTIIALLHPGTTDTQLSQPFQRNVPEGKLFPVERTVRQLLDVIEQLTPADSGEFFNWDGTRLPW